MNFCSRDDLIDKRKAVGEDALMGNFRVVNRDTAYLLPPSVDEWPAALGTVRGGSDFGIIKSVMGFRQFVLEKVKGERNLVTIGL